MKGDAACLGIETWKEEGTQRQGGRGISVPPRHMQKDLARHNNLQADSESYLWTQVRTRKKGLACDIVSLANTG